MTNKAQNLNLQEALTPYRVWIGEMDTLGWIRPVHLNIGDNHVTFDGIEMSRLGYWWSNNYDDRLRSEKQISCKPYLKKLRNKQQAETLEPLLSVYKS